MAGPYGVVVAGDQVLDQVGVAVGVDHGDDGDPEFVGLGDRNVFTDGVNHKDGVREAVHVFYASEVPLEFFQLPTEHQRFLLGHGLELAGIAHALVFLHLADTLGDGLEVGEHASQPALVHVGHAALLGERLDRGLGLSFSADK